MRLRPRGSSGPVLQASFGLALGVLQLGCSSSATTARSTPSPSATAAHAGLDAGWTLHNDSAAGFALAFPDAWAQAMADSPTLSDDLATIAANQPDVGGYFSSAFARSKTIGLALLAADPRTVGSGFTTNAVVFRSGLGPVAQAPDLDAITQGKLRALNKDSTISGTIDSHRASLGGREAERLSYVFKSRSKSVEVVSYVIVVDGARERIEFELTIGSATADYAQLFDKIAASFALISARAPSAQPAPAGSSRPTAAPGRPSPSPTG